MKHWYCEELNTGDSFLVYASNLFAAYKIANDFILEEWNEDEKPEMYVCLVPLTEDEAEALGLDEY